MCQVRDHLRHTLRFCLSFKKFLLNNIQKDQFVQKSFKNTFDYYYFYLQVTELFKNGQQYSFLASPLFFIALCNPFM